MDPSTQKGDALDRGVGILAYAGATKGGDDYDATEPFINGWFYVSETMFEELLSTLRADTAKDCSISLTVGPVSYETLDFVWDLEASPHLSVDAVEFNFTYRKDEEKPEASLMQRIFGN
ncbi:MAG: hypothetical protein ACK4MV_16190 [Beijerinckiaceae bacterium]